MLFTFLPLVSPEQDLRQGDLHQEPDDDDAPGEAAPVAREQPGDETEEGETQNGAASRNLIDGCDRHSGIERVPDIGVRDTRPHEDTRGMGAA